MCMRDVTKTGESFNLLNVLKNYGAPEKDLTAFYTSVVTEYGTQG